MSHLYEIELKFDQLRDGFIAQIVEQCAGQLHRSSCLSRLYFVVLTNLVSKKFVRVIHLIPNWRPINYSFVCMLNSPLRYVNMCKKPKEF